MSSSPPPTYYFSNIIFNPSYYTSSADAALTKSQANALYLRKTVADTAIANETFTAGMSTNSITPYNVATTTNLFDTLTSGVLNIATNALRSGTTNIGYYSTTADAGLSLTGGTGGAYLASFGSLTLASSSLIQIGSYPTKTSEIRIGYWPTSVATMDGAINIGTLNTLTSSPTNIYAGLGGMQLSAVADVSLTSSTGSIKNYSDTYIDSGKKLFTNAIDTATAGLLTLGGANCTGITFSDSIQSLTLGANQFISCGNNTSTASLLTTNNNYPFMGSYRDIAQNYTGPVATTNSYTIATATIATLGVYMIHYTFLFNNGGSSTLSQYKSAVTTSVGYVYVNTLLGPSSATTQNPYVAGSCSFVVSTNPTTVSVLFDSVFTGGSWSITTTQYNCKIVRIA